MKFFIVAFFLVAAANAQSQLSNISPEQRARALQHLGECIKSTGVSQELLRDARQGKVADDPKLDEFIFCVFRKADFISEAGVLNVAGVRAKIPASFPADQVEKLLTDCSVVTGPTPQKTAVAAFKCYFNENLHWI